MNEKIGSNIWAKSESAPGKPTTIDPSDTAKRDGTGRPLSMSRAIIGELDERLAGRAQPKRREGAR
jgi:hypothetical protein